MGFRHSDLQEAFFVPGDRWFRVCGYSTVDPLADVLRPGYFPASTILRPGDLIYFRSEPRPPSREPRPAPQPVHMALLMVVGSGARGRTALRLVQDFGPSDQPPGLPAPLPARLTLTPAAAEPSGTKRGRPTGSRTRRGLATNSHAGPS